MRLRIAICDPDTDYAMRMAEFIRNDGAPRTADIAVCTRPELLAEWRKSGRYDLYVVNVDWAERIGPVSAGDLSVVWLGERAGGSGPNGDAIWMKYTAAPVLIRNWEERARRSGAREDSGTAAVVGVWSPVGGAGRTTLIAHLAKLRSAMGLRTFAAGIDPGTVRTEAEQHDLSDWLFRIKSNAELELNEGEQESFPGSLVHTFSDHSSYSEWCALGAEEGKRLLDAAASLVGGGMVLADAGAGWSPWAETVWRESTVLICLVPDDLDAARKSDRWFAGWPEWGDGGAYRNKTVFALNRCLRMIAREASTSSWTDGAQRIPYVPEWKQDAHKIDPDFQRAAMRLHAEVEARCAER